MLRWWEKFRAQERIRQKKRLKKLCNGQRDSAEWNESRISFDINRENWFFSHFNSVWSVDDKSFSIIFNYLEYFYLTWPIRHRAPPSISYDLLGKSLNSWKLIPTGVLLCFWWIVKFQCDKIKKMVCWISLLPRQTVCCARVLVKGEVRLRS